MEGFTNFQMALQKTFSSLTVFSDLKWDSIFKEYLASHDERPQDVEEFTFNFPFYLQSKAQDGDCPSYLFELAYFELAQAQIVGSGFDFPKTKGLHLNPSATFLNLEFDVGKMMNEAVKGSVQVIARHHVLCLFKDPQSGLDHVEIDAASLAILQQLENGPLTRAQITDTATLLPLVKMGLVVEIP